MPRITINEGPPPDALDSIGTTMKTAAANARLIAAAPELYEVADEAPVLSKYHGQHGFESERFIADYEAWMAKRRTVLAKARGEP
jgi:enterochelin esterase-like enzyme